MTLESTDVEGPLYKLCYPANGTIYEYFHDNQRPQALNWVSTTILRLAPSKFSTPVIFPSLKCFRLLNILPGYIYMGFA